MIQITGKVNNIQFINYRRMRRVVIDDNLLSGEEPTKLYQDLFDLFSIQVDWENIEKQHHNQIKLNL
jgi:hypothetical protein